MKYKYTVIMTKHAEDDLNEIIAFIARNNPKTAKKIFERIQNKINTLDCFPSRGGYVAELLAKNIKDYRQITESPWRIIYRIDGKVVNILAIVDSRRNLQSILVKKLLKRNGLL
jgi:toxin ParE1/3/4